MRTRLTTAVLALLAVMATVLVADVARSQPVSAQAGTIVGRSSLAVATDVVNGSVLATQSVDTGTAVFSLALVDVDTAVTGDLSGQIFVEVPGGKTASGLDVIVSHQPGFRVGDQVQLALIRATPEEEQQLRGGEPVYSVVGGLEGAAATSGTIVSQAQLNGENFTLLGVKWDSFPVTYRINPSNDFVAPSLTTTILQNAFQEWEDDPFSDIDFVFGGQTTASSDNYNDGQNTLGWITPTSAADNFLALAVWVANNGSILSFDIQFNSSYVFSNGPLPGQFDLGTVALHEIGHVLGLGHISVPGAENEVMFPSLTAELVKGLGPGDREGAADLYPAANPPVVPPPGPITPLPVVDWEASEFVPIDPCEILDTRTDDAYGERLVGQQTVRVTLFDNDEIPPSPGSCAALGSIPEDAHAVMVNVVGVAPISAGNLRVVGSGADSSGGVVNFQPGKTNSNAVPVGITPEGMLDIHVNARSGYRATHVRAVALGYYLDETSASSQRFVPIVPCAVFDTRNGADFGARLTAGAALEVQITGPVSAGQTASDCPAASEVPAGTTTALVNVVAIGSTGAGSLQTSRPGNAPVGTVNFATSETNSNAVPARLSPDGKLELQVNSASGASAHVRMVVLGYYNTAVGDRFVPTAPCVILDTRNGSAFGARASGQSTSSVQVAGTIGTDQTDEPCAPSTVPAGATGAFVNVVAVAPQSNGNLRISAADAAPLGGVVNFAPGVTNANAVPVGLSPDGRLDVFVNAPSSSGTHVRLVLLGYYL